jgi:hypothetical protein
LNIDEFRGTKQWEGSTPICDSSSVLQKFFNSITNSVLLATGGSMSNMTELEAEHAISGDQELEQHERAEKFLSVVERLELQVNKQMYDHHEMKIIRNG